MSSSLFLFCRFFRVSVSAALLSCIFPAALLAAETVENTFETRLANGLKVVVREDRRAPIVTQMIWYKIGGVDEKDGASGLAHVLEHMMFKGTPKVGAGEFSRRVAAVGGRDNAFTSSDFTAYFQQMPRERLAEMMALEADRMRHLSVPPEEFAREIQVVMEERRMRTEDDPQASLFEAVNAIAFQTHPYRRPVIGWMDDLKHMTAQEAKAWHTAWYTPNNATLVICGDVRHEDVFALAQRHYGMIPARALPDRREIEEPEQKGPRRVTVRGTSELPLLVMAWKAPSISPAMGLETGGEGSAAYALEILSAILDGHDGARLPRRLVREQKIAAFAGTSYDNLNRGPALFYLYGSPLPGQTPEALEAAFRAELADIAANGVEESELTRARAGLLASTVYKRDSVFGQAMEIGFLETLGFSWRDDSIILKRLSAVTAEEVREAARRWFSDESLTLGQLFPVPLGEGKEAARAPQTNVSARH
ncbi:MAG: insulinase family protein [Zoogloeaceae bacterium]|jgi:zinc protease|nr:insulinase family protein [Zoogloeaceae bacterium]